MITSQHDIELDIFHNPYRPCRPYQERIAEYYMSGRPRFQWEKLRHKSLLEGDMTTARICEPCPLNILSGAEGCQIRVEALDSFLGMMAHLRPETPLSRFSFADDLLSVEDVRVLHTEFESISAWLPDVAWPVAQIFEYDEPRPATSGLRPYEYCEWEGGAADSQTIIYSNPGYTLCIARDGMVVRESLGEALPERFVRLWKEGASVYGETVGQRVRPFLPIADMLPAWDDFPPFVGHSEIRWIEMPATEIFGDIVESFQVFASRGLEHGIGLKISKVGFK